MGPAHRLRARGVHGPHQLRAGPRGHAGLHVHQGGPRGAASVAGFGFPGGLRRVSLALGGGAGVSYGGFSKALLFLCKAEGSPLISPLLLHRGKNGPFWGNWCERRSLWPQLWSWCSCKVLVWRVVRSEPGSNLGGLAPFWGLLVEVPKQGCGKWNPRICDTTKRASPKTNTPYNYRGRFPCITEVGINPARGVPALPRTTWSPWAGCCCGACWGASPGAPR